MLWIERNTFNIYNSRRVFGARFPINMLQQYNGLLEWATVLGLVLLLGQGIFAAGPPKPAAFREEINVDFDGKQATTQAPRDGNMTETECTNYNLKIGVSNVQYYSCCGGLKNKTIKHEPSFANFHCYPARIRYGLLNVTSRFDCSGLEGQKNAKDRCSDRWGWVDEPVDCWMWSECFTGACEQEGIKLGSSANPETDFCGDGRCDANIENSRNCAIDCCQVDNPKCVPFNNTCPEACCAEETCCLDAEAAKKLLVKQFWMIFLGIVALLALLVVVICCCCCYCCYSKCCKKKQQRRYSQMDIEMPRARNGDK